MVNSVSYREQWARNMIDFKPDMIAQYITDLMPTTMVFVSSNTGFSHCEQERTSLDHCWKGANVILHTILAVDKI